MAGARRSSRRAHGGPAGLVVAAVVVALLAGAACGGSSTNAETRPATTAPATTTSPSATTTSPSGRGGTSTVSTGPVRGALRADDHSPTVGRAWHYVVTVTDSAGRPLSGTVDIAFVFGGQVVGRDTPPTHRFESGRWEDTLTFPAAAVGSPLAVRAVVHTRLGSIVLDWPITVQR